MHTFVSQGRRMITVGARSARSAHSEYTSDMKLFPHQLALLRACRREEKKKQLHAILEAPAGSGKTIVMLALCQPDPGLTLVVVPQAIHSQWLQECERFGVRRLGSTWSTVR